MHIKELLEWEDRIERGKSLLQEAAQLRSNLLNKLERAGIETVCLTDRFEEGQIKDADLGSLMWAWTNHVKQKAIDDTRASVMGAYLL